MYPLHDRDQRLRRTAMETRRCQRGGLSSGIEASTFTGLRYPRMWHKEHSRCVRRHRLDAIGGLFRPQAAALLSQGA